MGCRFMPFGCFFNVITIVRKLYYSWTEVFWFCCVTVRMLQTSNSLWVWLCEPNIVGKPGEPGGWPGLPLVEQWSDPTVLQLQLLQGWSIGEPEKRMEKNQCDSHCCCGCADMGLPHCLQCLQECANRGPLPPLQTGMGLIFFNNFCLNY